MRYFVCSSIIFEILFPFPVETTKRNNINWFYQRGPQVSAESRKESMTPRRLGTTGLARRAAVVRKGSFGDFLNEAREEVRGRRTLTLTLSLALALTLTLRRVVVLSSILDQDS